MSENPSSISMSKKDQHAMESISFVQNFSNGLIGPYISMIALSLGATGIHLAWISSISNLFVYFFNPLFGRLSDKTRKRKPFIIFSNLTWFIPYLLILWAKTPLAIIICVGCVYILMSIGVSPWNAFQNELFPAKERAELSSKLFWVAAIATMIATFITGIFLTLVFGEIPFQQIIYLPVILSFLMASFASFRLSRVRQPMQKPKSVSLDVSQASRDVEGIPKEENNSTLEGLRSIWNNKPFRKYAILSTFYSLFQSMFWPMFSYKQISILEASNLEIAILAISMNFAIFLTVRPGARLSDRFGRKYFIWLSRITPAFFVFFYILATEVWHLVLIHIVINGIFNLWDPSNRAYLMDIIPEDEGGTYYGVFNLLTGVACFFGALLGGYIFDSANAVYSTATAFAIAVGISLIGRFCLSWGFLTLKDVKTFPESLSNVIKKRKS